MSAVRVEIQLALASIVCMYVVVCYWRNEDKITCQHLTLSPFMSQQKMLGKF